MRARSSSLLAGITCLAMLGVFAAPAIASSRIAPQQLLAVVLANHTVTNEPNGKRVWMLNARRPITGARTVLPVLSRILSSSGQFWLQVRLPGRAIGGATPPKTGWISASSTALETTPWHIVVDLSARQVIVYKAGEAMRRVLGDSRQAIDTHPNRAVLRRGRCHPLQGTAWGTVRAGHE